MPGIDNNAQVAVKLFMKLANIKKLYIVEKEPVYGYLCIGDNPLWLPINENETLQGWLSNHCINISIEAAKVFGKCKRLSNWISDKIEIYREECERDEIIYDGNGYLDIDDIFISIMTILFIKYCYNPRFKLNRSFQITISNNFTPKLKCLVISDDNVIYIPTINDNIPSLCIGPVCNLKNQRKIISFLKIV